MEGSSTSASKGSNGIITGTFGPVAQVEYLLKNYHKLLNEAFKEQAKLQQEELQKKARETGAGWESVADKIRVKYDSTSGTYTYYLVGGKKVQAKAMELEYGTPEQAPTPLFRTTVLERQNDMGNNIVNSINSSMNKAM